jgi:pectate lyase-like protein
MSNAHGQNRGDAESRQDVSRCRRVPTCSPGEHGGKAMTERIVLLAFLCLLARTAAGQTLRYVSPSGSDANPGTAALPFQTIGKAAQVVNPGDTVIVENGVYHEALNLTRSGTANAYVTFMSQTKWGAVLDGNQNSLAEAVQFTANYIRFQGFEIRGYGANGSADAFSNYPGGQFLDIAQNYVHDIGRLCTSTTNGLVGVFLEAPNVTIEQNLFADIGRYAPGENGCNPSGAQYQNHDHGVYVDSNSNNVTIKNNVFYRIERGWGIQVYPSGVDSLAILNNTFAQPNPYRVGHIIIAASGPMTNLRIENNISYKPTTAFTYFYSYTAISGTIANNLIYNGAVGDATPGGVTFSGNFTNTDPLLVNSGNSTLDDPVMVDAHLTSGSPAIDAGLIGTDVTNDYDGTTRPQGSANDIGAFEFGAAAAAKPLAPTGLSVTVH